MEKEDQVKEQILNWYLDLLNTEEGKKMQKEHSNLVEESLRGGIQKPPLPPLNLSIIELLEYSINLISIAYHDENTDSFGKKILEVQFEKAVRILNDTKEQLKK